MDTSPTLHGERAKVHRMIDDLPDPQTLHQLIDELPLRELHWVEYSLETLHDLADPVQRALNIAPPDDEPVTPEDAHALEAAEDEVRRDPSRIRTLDEVRRELGL
jgi:hypothetical protein